MPEIYSFLVAARTASAVSQRAAVPPLSKEIKEKPVTKLLRSVYYRKDRHGKRKGRYVLVAARTACAVSQRTAVPPPSKEIKNAAHCEAAAGLFFTARIAMENARAATF